MGKNNYSVGVGHGYGGIVDFSDKLGSVRQYVAYMLCRTQSMFRYTGLPDTIPQRDLELMIQSAGFAGVTKVGDDLYAFTGGLGGMPDAYYKPTILTVANPALNFNKMLKIDEECVIIPNDSLLIGLLPLFNRYASMLAENDVTIRLADINARIINLISSGDDRTLESAKDYLRDIERGKLGVVAENSFLDGIRTQPYSASGSTNNITQLIELQQYLKAGWYNEIGLDANYNMKREAVNTSEAQMNDDALLPLVDDMLNQRKTAIKKINLMFGTHITVDLASSWEDRQEVNNDEDEIDRNISGLDGDRE